MFAIEKIKNNIPWVHTPMKCLVRVLERIVLGRLHILRNDQY